MRSAREILRIGAALRLASTASAGASAPRTARLDATTPALARSVSTSAAALAASPTGGLAELGLTPEQRDFRGELRCLSGGSCLMMVLPPAALRVPFALRRPRPRGAAHLHPTRAPPQTQNTTQTELASAFAAEHLAPHAARWDAESHFPIDTLRAAAALGFGGLYLPEALGGAGLGRADGAAIFEALAYGDGARHGLRAVARFEQPLDSFLHSMVGRESMSLC